MAISDLLRAAGPAVLRMAMGELDNQNDDKTRELMKASLRKLVASSGLPKERMRRLALLLAESASGVGEELK